MTDVKLGLTFTLVLCASGKLYMEGAITQEGTHVIDTQNRLICFNEKMGIKDAHIAPAARKFYQQRMKEKGQDT